MAKAPRKKEMVSGQCHLGDEESDLNSVKFWKGCEFDNKNLYDEVYGETSNKKQKELASGGGENVTDISKCEQEDFWLDKDSLDNLTHISQNLKKNYPSKKFSPKVNYESSSLEEDSHKSSKIKNTQSQFKYADEQNFELQSHSSIEKQSKHKISDNDHQKKVEWLFMDFMKNGFREQPEIPSSTKPNVPSTSFIKEFEDSFNTLSNLDGEKSFFKPSSKISSKQIESLQNDSVDQAVADMINFANQLKEVNNHLKQKQEKLSQMNKRKSALCEGKEEELCLDDRHASYKKPFLSPKPPVIKIEPIKLKPIKTKSPSLISYGSTIKSPITSFLKDLQGLLNSHFKKKYNTDMNERIIKLVNSKDLRKKTASLLNPRMDPEEELRNTGLDMLRSLLRKKLLS